MKIFKKRKPLKSPDLTRVPFEQIVKDVFDAYKDNMVCSKDTREAITAQITQQIRKQLPNS